MPQRTGLSRGRARGAGAGRGHGAPSAKVVELRRFRCNCCDEVFEAPAPEGTGTDKYNETASSMVGSLRYGLGTPFYHLEEFQGGLGVPLPVGTQWKLVKKAGGSLSPPSTT